MAHTTGGSEKTDGGKHPLFFFCASRGKRKIAADVLVAGLPLECCR
jgi:hypothetical protein